MPPQLHSPYQSELVELPGVGHRRRTAALALLWIGFLATSVHAFFYLLQPGVRVTLPEIDVPVRVDPPPRILVVVLDALRADVAEDRRVMPALAELRAQASSGYHRTGPFPVSASFYKAFLAGRPASMWDVYNDLSPRPRHQESWVQRGGLSCYYSGPASGYAWLAGYAHADYVWYLDRMERIPEHDRRAFEATLRRLAGTDHGILICHLASLDAAAHREGGRSAQYLRVARRLDDAVLQLSKRLDLQRDLLLVLSDHGVRDDGGHSSGIDPAVSMAPFVARGPMFRRQRQVTLDQTAWPILMAAVTGCPVPAYYSGTPPPPILVGPAARRLCSLNQKYTQLLLQELSARSVAAAVRPMHQNADSAAPRSAHAALAAAKREAELSARMIWWLCTAAAIGLTVVTLKQCPPYCSHAYAVLALLIAGSASLWLGVEGLQSAAGQLDGTFIDGLPQFRAHEFAVAPWRVLATFALTAATVVLLSRTGFQMCALTGVILCAGVLGLQRNRTDILLYSGVAWALLCVFTERTRPPIRRAALAVCILFPLAAIGQKLSYDTVHHTGMPWSAAVSVLVLAAFALCAVRNRLRFPLASALVSALGCVARATEHTGLAAIAWLLLAVLIVAPLCVRLRSDHFLFGVSVALAPLVLPWPQMWPVFLLGCTLWVGPSCDPASDVPSRGRLMAAHWLVSTQMAVLVCLLLFFYGSGRDTYLSINEFYRSALGAEVEGVQFSMARAALAVAARFALYVSTAVALAQRAFPTVSMAALISGLLGFFSLRLSANSLAFALFAKRAWNYHLALLFNDAMFLAATALIALWTLRYTSVNVAPAEQQR